jgi:chromosome partitioning protein
MCGTKRVSPMEKRCYKPVEAARMLGMSKDELLDFERVGKIPLSQRDAKGNRCYTVDQVEKIRDLVGVRPVLANPPRVIAVFNMKGGVGKSTVSANLAVKISEKGYRILAMDADPQGHLTTSLGEEPASFQATLLQVLIPDRQGDVMPAAAVRQEISPNLHLVPGNLSMWSLNLLLFQQPEREYRLRRAVESIRATGDYDIVIIDSPPSYDITSLNILLSCDLVVAPVKLDGNSFYGLEYLFDTIRYVNRTYRYQIPTVAIVPNHYNGSYSVSRQMLQGLRANYASHLTRTVIRQDVNFDKANALRQPIFAIAPSCRGSKDMEGLAEEVCKMLTRKPASEEIGT